MKPNMRGLNAAKNISSLPNLENKNKDYNSASRMSQGPNTNSQLRRNTKNASGSVKLPGIDNSRSQRSNMNYRTGGKNTRMASRGASEPHESVILANSPKSEKAKFKKLQDQIEVAEEEL